MSNHYLFRTWDIGDPQPGREYVDVVESMFFSDEDGDPIRFVHDMTMGFFSWRVKVFGMWTHLEWEDVVRRFGPVRALRVHAVEE